jgi:hypothetical protein
MDFESLLIQLFPRNLNYQENFELVYNGGPLNLV